VAEVGGDEDQDCKRGAGGTAIRQLQQFDTSELSNNGLRDS